MSTSTIVRQNLVSCFDSQLTETTATLKLRVAAAPPPAAPDLCSSHAADDHSPRNLELGNWGFLRTNSEESCYTHPLSKNTSSFSKLSPKSLQLCTENLGSETGSDTASDCSSIFSASPPLSPSGDDRKTFDLVDDCRQKRTASPSSQKSCRKINNFPPPLTTMSAGSSMQVRRRSEGGRLIMEAVEGPFRNSYLHAERSDGRLKLSFSTAAAAAAEEPEQEAEEEENLDECGGSAAAAAAEEEETEEARNIIESEIDGEKNLIEKFKRYRRCKESGHGNKGLCNNWKPALWVATS